MCTENGGIMAKRKVKIGDDNFMRCLTLPTVCKQCGKSFERPGGGSWAYRRWVYTGDIFFCSWHCLRAYDKSKEKKHDRYFD